MYGTPLQNGEEDTIELPGDLPGAKAFYPSLLCLAHDCTPNTYSALAVDGSLTVRVSVGVREGQPLTRWARRLLLLSPAMLPDNPLLAGVWWIPCSAAWPGGSTWPRTSWWTVAVLGGSYLILWLLRPVPEEPILLLYFSSDMKIPKLFRPTLTAVLRSQQISDA